MTGFTKRYLSLITYLAYNLPLQSSVICITLTWEIQGRGPFFHRGLSVASTDSWGVPWWWAAAHRILRRSWRWGRRWWCRTGTLSITVKRSAWLMKRRSSIYHTIATGTGHILRANSIWSDHALLGAGWSWKRKSRGRPRFANGATDSFFSSILAIVVDEIRYFKLKEILSTPILHVNGHFQGLNVQLHLL